MIIQIDTDKIKNASLDQIIELVFSNASEEQAPSDFDFHKKNERRIMGEIRKYTSEIRNTDLGKEEIRTLDDVVEEFSTGLTDTVSCVNLDYFKQGMKFGARLLLELTA